jgi:DNA-binding transcriptional MerR regulator
MSDNDCTNQYSIKAVALATGLSVETLRAWERRYGIIEPKRDCNGHRVYSGCDVARLRRLSDTTNRGHSIGKIAHLSDTELNGLLAQPPQEQRNHTASCALAGRILAAIERYDHEECDQAIAMAFALLPVADVISDVLAPVLRDVGDRWQRGEFTVAQERLVSSSVRRQISGLLNTFNSMARGTTIVFATLSGEMHELGILMHAALAASRKFRVCYLGADLPPEEIANLATRVRAGAVAISLILPEELDGIVRKLGILKCGLPEDVEIWLGGAASFRIDPRQFPASSIHMAGRCDFEHRLDLLYDAAS